MEDLNYGCSILITTFSKTVIRLIISVARLFGMRIGLAPRPASIEPSRRFLVQSTKHNSRNIEVHIYDPPSAKEEDYPLPVHVSFHGSGFCLPCFGVDAELCAYIASNTGCIVVDADYAKGPQHPHPAAVDDALDVLAFVASRPDIFDHRRVSVGGYSSGGNIAMLAALSLPKSVQLSIKAIVAWYAPTDLTRAGKGKKVPWILQRTHQASRQCYLPPGKDLRDPKISPLFEDSSLFPPTTLIVGDLDKLYFDSLELHKKLINDGVECVLHTVRGANHAWERFVKPGTPLWDARIEAFELMAQRLRLAHQ